MARIRSIKPEFFTSEQIVECSSNARLLFVGLLCFSDDAGRHVASPRRLQMEVFPGDPLKPGQVAGWMGELIRTGLVLEYEAQSQRYWQVTGWQKHQRVEKPTIKYPDPFGDDSTIIRRAFAEPSPTESSRVESKGVESKGVESKGVESKGVESKVKDMSADADDTDTDGNEQLRDWLRWWNRLHAEGLVSSGVNEEHPSEALRIAWRRCQRSSEIRELLAQREALEGRIRESEFCREGWFRMEKILGGKNRDKELILRKLLEGGYKEFARYGGRNEARGAYDSRRPDKPRRATF